MTELDVVMRKLVDDAHGRAVVVVGVPYEGGILRSIIMFDAQALLNYDVDVEAIGYEILSAVSKAKSSVQP